MVSASDASGSAWSGDADASASGFSAAAVVAGLTGSISFPAAGSGGPIIDFAAISGFGAEATTAREPCGATDETATGAFSGAASALGFSTAFASMIGLSAGFAGA